MVIPAKPQGRLRSDPVWALFVARLSEVGLTVKEISLQLGVSENQVVNLLGYGRRLVAVRDLPLPSLLAVARGCLRQHGVEQEEHNHEESGDDGDAG